jgi:hypothetical protein
MMQKNLNKARYLVLLLFCGWANAQTFNYNGRLDSVRQSGFYAFRITPALSALVETDFRDLRIRDSMGNPVPYLIASNIPLLRPGSLETLDIVKNTKTDSGQSVLVVENIQQEKTDGLYIRFRNAAVSRTINLSGSQDGKKWYSIIENISLERRFIQDKDSFLENISFPLSSYRFYRVVIYNGKNDPLDILSVQKQVVKDSAERQVLIQNPDLAFIRKDSSKITWISIANPKRFHVSTVNIHVKSPRFFKRQVDVFANNFLVGNFTISTDSLFHLQLPLLNDSVLNLRIYNEDNPPLDISAISTTQNEEKIIVYLDSGKSYQVEMQNAAAVLPHYDLINFKDSIPKNIRQIGMSDISYLPALRTVNHNDLGNRGWLWLTLAIVLIALGLFTVRLTKEVGKRQ